MLDLLSALPIALPKRSAAAPTPAPLLIPELLAALLSHADQLTLARASRVCALWHVSAQPILDARPLHLSCSSQSRLSSLNAMLRARPEVAERVAQVAVDLTRHVGNTTALESESRSARCLVTRCPNLVELEISTIGDTPVLELLPSRIFPNPSLDHLSTNLTHLRLSGAELGSNQVSWILHGLTALRHLALTGFSFPFNAPGCAPRPSYRLVSASLAEWRQPKQWLERFLSDYCVGWLLGESQGSLEELGLAHCQGDVFPRLREGLPALRRVGVRLTQGNWRENLAELLAVARAPGLEQLEVRLEEALKRAPVAAEAGGVDAARLRAALAGLSEAERAKVKLTHQGSEFGVHLDRRSGRRPVDV